MLARYAQVFDAVEINSSFYRPHKPQTYARWAASVPESFRFSVKVPKTVTHDRRLVDPEEALARFFTEIAELGPKLGPVLIQLPPSLAFGPDAAAFLGRWREHYAGATVLEPRHASWFTAEAQAQLVAARIARVAADPAVVADAARPGGWGGLAYARLHGSPVMYSSAYGDEAVAGVAAMLDACSEAAETWCIYDNTRLGAATADALVHLHRYSAAENAGAALEPGTARARF